MAFIGMAFLTVMICLRIKYVFAGYENPLTWGTVEFQRWISIICLVNLKYWCN